MAVASVGIQVTVRSIKVVGQIGNGCVLMYVSFVQCECCIHVMDKIFKRDG